MKRKSHWILLPWLFVIHACGGHPGPKTGDTPPDTLTSAIGQVQQGFALPKITPINELNLPKKVKAGKPTIKEDLTGGGTPFFINYGKEQGLSNNRVNKSIIDNQGNLWFGTGEGVSKYDGKAFTTYSSANGMPAAGVWSIIQDNKGNIWFGTLYGGVSIYDGKTFTNYTVAQGLAGDYVLSMMQDNVGHIWFATNGGVSQFDGHTFTTYTTAQGLLSSFTQCIMQDAKGNIWMGCQKGVMEYNGKTFTDRTASLGLPYEEVQSIVQDSKGNMWFTSWGSGVAKYDGKTTTHYTTAQGLADNRIRYILEDKFGNLWFAAFSGGVSKYDGRTFLNYSTAEGLADNSIRSILEDRAGNLWFGTLGGGISKLRSRGLQYFSPTRWLPDWDVQSIALDQKGDIWLASRGITKYNGKYFTSFTSDQGLMHTSNKYAGDRIGCILSDSKGHLWLASANGLDEYDGRSFTIYSTAQGLPNDFPNCMIEDSGGHIWIGAGSDGVFELDGRSVTNYKIEQGLAGDSVYGIAPDGMGNLWFATNGGASKFDGKNFTTFTKAQGLPSNHVLCVLKVSRGNLWFGTDSGASVYDGKRFRTYTVADGLTGNSIAALIEDSGRHILWFGTDRGLSGLNLDSPFHFEDFSINNGYPIYEVRPNCFCLDKNGILWFGTFDNKFMKFDYSLAKNKLPPLTLFIESVRVNNESICWNNLRRKPSLNSATDSLALLNEMAMTFGALLPATGLDSMRQKYSHIRFDSVARFYPVPVNLVLPNQDNTISIDFVAIDPASTQRVAFQYLLEGHDRDWSNLSNNTTAVFGNLWEGHYTFKLRALSPNGTWTYTEYVFTVLPPWYRTWWAYALFIVVVVGIVWGLIYYRSRQLRRENRLLEEKVALRTNQLQASIEDLKATQSQLIQSEKMASLGELTAGIAHEIQNPLNFVNNFSEVNKELLEEMKEEIDKGNFSEVKPIANDIIENEDKINHHGKRADAIVKGMLQHSRTSSGQKEPTDVNALADEYLRLSYHGLRAKDKSFNASLQTDFDENIGRINLIPQDIGRVLLNLYNNAFYAVAAKKKMQPEGYEPTVAVSTKKMGDKVEISVRDNGTGIPPKALDKIFQPFFTTKPPGQGTGLGLSLSYDIIRAHGGELKVQTKEGEGTAFVVRIP